MKTLIYSILLLGLVGCGSGGDGGGGASNDTTPTVEVVPDPPVNCATDPDLIGTWQVLPLKSSSFVIDEFCVAKGGTLCGHTAYLSETTSEEDTSKSITLQVVKANNVSGCMQKGTYACSYKWYYPFPASDTLRMQLVCPGVGGTTTYEKF